MVVQFGNQAPRSKRARQPSAIGFHITPNRNSRLCARAADCFSCGPASASPPSSRPRSNPRSPPSTKPTRCPPSTKSSVKTGPSTKSPNSSASASSPTSTYPSSAPSPAPRASNEALRCRRLSSPLMAIFRSTRHRSAWLFARCAARQHHLHSPDSPHPLKLEPAFALAMAERIFGHESIHAKNMV